MLNEFSKTEMLKYFLKLYEAKEFAGDSEALNVYS